MSKEIKATPETAIVETTQPAQPETATVPTDNTLELTGKGVYSISFVEANVPYKKGKRNENGKTFTRYSRNNIAFSVPTEHPFNADFNNGQVKSVTLTLGTAEVDKVDENGDTKIVTVPTIQFASYINKNQWETVRNEELEDAKAEFAISRFKKLKTENVSADFLNALLGASA
jgi:hypothetical protein